MGTHVRTLQASDVGRQEKPGQQLFQGEEEARMEGGGGRPLPTGHQAEATRTIRVSIEHD